MATFISQLDWRFATKSFDAEKKVSDTDLNTILEAIRKAPTSLGTQPFHVIRVTNPELRATLRSHGYNQPQITDAAEFLVFCGRNDLEARIDTIIEAMSGGDSAIKATLAPYEQMMRGTIAGKTPEQLMNWSSRQSYIALGFGLAACAELGIDSCPMEGFDPEAFATALELPSHIKPFAALAIGYRKEDPTHPKFRLGADELFSTR